MKFKVYIETTIPSYVTAWPSRDLIKVAQQEATREWWETRDRFELVVSQLVLEEAGGGDSEAAAARVKVLDGLPVLRITDEAVSLAARLVSEGPLPEKARRGRAPHRPRRERRCRAPADVELQAHRQRGHAQQDRGRLPLERLRAAGHLHTRGVDGGLIMWHDPIVDEVREIRDAYAKRFGYDLEAIARDLREKEEHQERPLIDPSPRKIDPETTRRPA